MADDARALNAVQKRVDVRAALCVDRPRARLEHGATGHRRGVARHRESLERQGGTGDRDRVVAYQRSKRPQSGPQAVGRRNVTQRGDSLVMHGADASAQAAVRQRCEWFRGIVPQDSPFRRPKSDFCPVMPPAVSMNARFARWSRRLTLGALIVPAMSVAGCDRIKAALKNEESTASAGDPVWQVDSARIARKPAILFRVITADGKTSIAPIAELGSSSLRSLRMGNRGWRAFDIAYMEQGATLTALRDGAPSGTVRVTRSMFEGGTAIDTVPRCSSPIPIAFADAPSDTYLAISGNRPTTKPTTALSSSELDAVLSTISTLIAPAASISTSMLTRYKREIHVLPIGATSRPTIVATFNDPEQVPDTVQPIAQRPRQLVVVLDKGVYGYRTSYQYATVGNAQSNPRLTFLGTVDIDSDGVGELLFGFKDSERHDVISVFKLENEAWREAMRAFNRCQV